MPSENRPMSRKTNPPSSRATQSRVRGDVGIRQVVLPRLRLRGFIFDCSHYLHRIAIRRVLMYIYLHLRTMSLIRAGTPMATGPTRGRSPRQRRLRELNPGAESDLIFGVLMLMIPYSSPARQTDLGILRRHTGFQGMLSMSLSWFQSPRAHYMNLFAII